MPRPLRIEDPGIAYAVLNRGDRGERICRDDNNHKRLLAPLGRLVSKVRSDPIKLLKMFVAEMLFQRLKTGGTLPAMVGVSSSIKVTIARR